MSKRWPHAPYRLVESVCRALYGRCWTKKAVDGLTDGFGTGQRGWLRRVYDRERSDVRDARTDAQLHAMIDARLREIEADWRRVNELHALVEAATHQRRCAAEAREQRERETTIEQDLATYFPEVLAACSKREVA